MDYQFPSALTADEIKKRLQSKTKPITGAFLWPLPPQTFLCSLEGNQFCLLKTGAPSFFVRPSYSFYGSILDKKDHCVIRGNFKIGRLTRILMFAFIGFACLMMLLRAAPFEIAQSETLHNFTLGWVAFVIFVVAILPNAINKRLNEDVLHFILDNLLD